MKIETCENTFWTMFWLITAAVLINLVWALAWYNRIVYDKGYTAVQEVGSQEIMWVKPQK